MNLKNVVNILKFQKVIERNFIVLLNAGNTLQTIENLKITLKLVKILDVMKTLLSHPKTKKRSFVLEDALTPPLEQG